jgi:hypothetical protein
VWRHGAYSDGMDVKVDIECGSGYQSDLGLFSHQASLNKMYRRVPVEQQFEFCSADSCGGGWVFGLGQVLFIRGHDHVPFRLLRDEPKGACRAVVCARSSLVAVKREFEDGVAGAQIV